MLFFLRVRHLIFQEVFPIMYAFGGSIWLAGLPIKLIQVSYSGVVCSVDEAVIQFEFYSL